MKRTALSFGLLSGAIIIVYSAAIFIFFGDFSKISLPDLEKVEKLGYLRYLILLLTVIFAIRHFKKQLGGQGSFKQLFLAGIYTSLVVALLVGLMEFVYMLINPGFMEQYGSLMSERLKAGGASAAEIAAHEQQMASYKWLANPAAMGVFYFLETAVLGTIMSVIVALVKKTKRA
ncbi:MAG TPA: DUF4199 domain-containing protein [Flavisolibacter sp.]|nr:DUF4199 domain-containing protein [Flavisolibacter sp.]